MSAETIDKTTYLAAADGIMSLADTFQGRDPAEQITIASVLDLFATTAEMLEIEASTEGAPTHPRLNKSGRGKVATLVRRRDHLRRLESRSMTNSYDSAEESALTWALQRLGMEDA